MYTILNPHLQQLEKEIFPLVDYFTPNETEASFYIDGEINTVDDAKKHAQSILDLGVKNVLITLGEKGAYFFNQDDSHFEPALDLTNQVVDTSGQVMHLMEHLPLFYEGRPIVDAIKFANCFANIYNKNWYCKFNAY